MNTKMSNNTKGFVYLFELHAPKENEIVLASKLKYVPIKAIDIIDAIKQLDIKLYEFGVISFSNSYIPHGFNYEYGESCLVDFIDSEGNLLIFKAKALLS